jgi:hypothetical protein
MQVSVSTSKEAVEAIRSKFYDLIIFCQTISNETAHALIAHARAINPKVKTLAIHLPGQQRDVDADLYETQFQNPGLLLSAVDQLLQSSGSKSSHRSDRGL